MQLKALRYFLMVSSTGSFQATARHFQVPPSSVSRYIAALEQELGQQLLYRSTRAVRLTDEGLRFHSQVKEAVDILDVAAGQMARRDEDINGLVRINAPEALGRLHIAGLVNNLQGRYPGLTVELTLTDAFIDPVQEGADITVRVGPLIDSGLSGRVLGPQRYLVAASPSYLEVNGMPETPEDLARHDCLLYKGLQGTQKWYHRCSPEQRYSTMNVSGPFRSNNAEVLVAAALAGRGIVLFPTWLFSADNFSTGTLVKLLTEWDMAASSEPSFIQILSPENRLRSRRVRKVTDFIVQAVGTPPYWDKC